jgi:nucleoside-diphosphate-sugar epimerase
LERVLITGGTGFIGSHLARRLAGEGWEVHILARPASSLWRIEDFVQKVTVWRSDVTDPASLGKCVESSRPGAVFHLAGDTSARVWTAGLGELDSSIDVNLRGTLNLLRALQKTRPRKFIRAGGLAEYGEEHPPFDEEQRERPVSAYGASQAATTMCLSALRRQLAFHALTLRFAAVYGPGRSPDFFLPALILSLLEGRDFEMTAGDQLWDLIYVEDAVEALMKALHADTSTVDLVNIGGGCACSLREIAAAVKRKIGGPGRVLAGAIPPRAGDIQNLYCRCDRAREVLAWQPHTSLDAGLDRTIAWYREWRRHESRG